MDYAKKTLNFSDIDSESFRCTEPTIYEILWDGVKYEICVNYKADSKNAVIFGSGAYGLEYRSKFPIFNRISWADDISCTGIWYFDPTLYLGDELKVGWGYGTNDRWYLEDIARLVEIILGKLNISKNNTLFYGSSAGGFMSIILATMFRSKASVINSQFNIRDYSKVQLQNIEKAALKEGETFIEDRISVTEFMKKENFVPIIHILDNVLSDGDIFTQLSALTHGLFDNKLDCTNRISIDLFCDERGHNGIPDKDACIETIESDLNRCIALEINLKTEVVPGKVNINVSSDFAVANMEYRYSLFNGDHSKLFHQSGFINEPAYSVKLTESADYCIDVTAKYRNPGTGVVVNQSASDKFRYEVPVKVNAELKLSQNKLTVTANAMPADKHTTYACYLYSAQTKAIVCKLPYQSKPSFSIRLEDSGEYYAKVFVNTKDARTGETFCTTADSQSVKYFSPSMKVGSKKQQNK